MPTQLDIYNRAMSAMGSRSTIASTAETSTEVLALAQHYTPLRQELLESFLWNFARRAGGMTLLKSHPSTPGSAAVGTTWANASWPDPPWMYEYQVPTDFIRARWIAPRTGATALASVSPMPGHDMFLVMNPPYRFAMSSDVDGSANPVKTILTDINDPALIYTADITDPNGWSPLFTQALVFYLAGRVAIHLAMDFELAKLNIAQAEALLSRAKSASANQGLTPTVSIPDWIRARGVSITDDSLGYLP